MTHTSNYKPPDKLLLGFCRIYTPFDLCSFSIPQYISQLQSVHTDTPKGSTESHTGNNVPTGTTVRKKNINLCFTSITQCMSSLHRITQ